MTLKSLWSAEQVPGQSRIHSETLSLNNVQPQKYLKALIQNKLLSELCKLFFFYILRVFLQCLYNKIKI